MGMKIILQDNKRLIITKLPNEIFKYCTSIKTFSLPSTLTTIGAEAFRDCKMSEIDIPDSVTTIGNCAFYECYNLTSITFPDSVTAINGAIFEGCSNLESVTIGAGVTTIDGAAFYDCYPTSITVSNNNKYYSSDEYGVLFNKDKTTLIQYPIGNTRTSYTIPDSVKKIGYAAFAEQLLQEVGISCMKVSVTCLSDKVDDVGHARNFVRVDDDKYGIHGLYARDITWDSDKDIAVIEEDGQKTIVSRPNEELQEKVVDKYDSLILYRHFLIPMETYEERYPEEINPTIYEAYKNGHAK